VYSKGVEAVKTRRKAGKVAFRPRARLLKLIGEELISDEVVAVSELVKNAHDADALRATITFRSITGPDGEIEVHDDGFGMNLDTLLGRWMEPAASTKTAKGRQVTRLGRRVLGEKGVGRFAADKLARNLEIVSRCPSRSDEVRVVIDWDHFNSDALMLDEVLSQWEVRPARELKSHGTILHLRGLRSTWTERMFRRLSLRLSRLLSPFRDDRRFTIRIESDEFPEYSGEIRADFLDRAPYRIEATFDGRETIAFTLNGRKLHQHWNGQGELTCGPVRIRLYAFDLEGEAIAKIGPRLEVRAWLKEWSGVSIYRDGFRVLPYGEPHDDWLRLDQRRVNNPVEHLSNNQIIGFIDISRDRNPQLLDQTNREGLMHNQAMEDLRRLLYFVLQLLEAQRQSVRHPVMRPVQVLRAANTEAESIGAGLEQLAAAAPSALAREIRQVKAKIQETLARQAGNGRKQVEGYFGLAAVGQMASGLARFLPGKVARLQEEVKNLRRTVNGSADPAAREALDQLLGAVSRVNESLRMLAVSSGNADRRRAIDIAAELESFRELAEPVLREHGIKLDITCSSGAVLRTEMRPENFHCLLQILTANAMDWLRKVDEPRIRIGVQNLDDECKLLFADNGPGIPRGVGDRIFDPLFSRKEGGRGMGLTIARRLLESHGGSLSILLDGRRKGANFLVTFPRKKSRATIYKDQTASDDTAADK
jgi:signal transduction histidine kinase